EQEFTAGWIALRFLNDASLAAQHFARIGVGSVNPTTLARAGYWQGRAAEAAGRAQEARAAYTRAAEQSTSYYGQLARAKLGLPFDHYAYPGNGIPAFKQIGPEVERSIVYAIARQESAFNPSVVSPAQAYGLMQVTPDAARYVCKRHGATYGLARLKNDSAYNATLGAAELGGLLEDYRGSYIMTFAAYNAGRGSVKKWIDRYGDPRDPKVDAVD